MLGSPREEGSSRRSIPLDETLPIAKQIAEALEAAHEQGIIHRDLKPANIKVRADGTVKVLDFGLAKAFDAAASSGAGATMSPTLSIHATQAGIILGTAAYMAPEQARGKAVDKRADIWAFGCVVYEMLTGRRAFGGDDVSITLAAVMMKEPEWMALPGATPVGLRRLLTRCLKKDPKERLRDIGEARIAIDSALSGAVDDSVPSATGRRAPWRHSAIAVAVVGLLSASVTGAVVWFALRSSPPRAIRTTITSSSSATALWTSNVDRTLAIASDGSRLVYVGDNGAQLFVRVPVRRSSTATCAASGPPVCAVIVNSTARAPGNNSGQR
jgi:serine/threonine-protein kinase